MIIAHVTFTVTPDLQSRALSILVDQAEAVRNMNGCYTFIPFADPTVVGGVGVMHQWETSDDFAGYLASESFSVVNEVLRPLLTSTPISRRFSATPLNTPG